MSLVGQQRINLALWAAQGLLVVAFELCGIVKACVPAGDLQLRMHLLVAAPAQILPVVGGIEAAGAVLLLLPSTLRLLPVLTPLAAAVLAAVSLLGAAIPSSGAGLALLLPNLALAALAAFVAWGRLAAAPIEPFVFEAVPDDTGEPDEEEPVPARPRPTPRPAPVVRPWATA